MAKNGTFKEKLQNYVEKFVNTNRPDLKDNIGNYLGEIFAWQELAALATTRLKEAWANAQSSDGILIDDEDIREKPEGELILDESPHFSCLVKVGAARMNFNRELFIDEVARKYKIKKTDLIKLADECKKKSAVPLTKRVVEV